jgi:hypothetical protein
MLNWGAFCFGLVIGWVTYRTLRKSKTSGLGDIAIVIGAVGGAAVTTLFPSKDEVFGAYCIGLVIGFFAYLIISGIIELQAPKKPSLKSVARWLGAEPEEIENTNSGAPRLAPPSSK